MPHLDAVDKRRVLTEILTPFLCAECARSIRTNVDVVEQNMALKGYLGTYVQQLQARQNDLEDLCQMMMRTLETWQNATFQGTNAMAEAFRMRDETITRARTVGIRT